jgi:hypothetical protein
MTPSTTTNTALKVLLLGVHIGPGEPFTEEALIKMIEADIANGPQYGLDIQYRLTNAAEPEYAAIIAKLRDQPWDIVAVGAGVRYPKERAALFEWLVNAAVRFVKPIPVLVFNTSPDGVVQACLRVRPEVERLERPEQET